MALAPKKGQCVGKARVLGLAAGSVRKMSPPLLHHLEGFEEQYTRGGWHPADGCAANPEALSVVLQAEMLWR